MHKDEAVLFAQFRAEVADQLTRITHLCATWGIPQLATHVTLILRDPTDDAMCLLLTDEASVMDAARVAQQLEQEEDDA